MRKGAIMSKKVDRGIIEGRETPEDDMYILTDNGDILWADDAIDAERVEEEIKNKDNNDTN